MDIKQCRQEIDKIDEEILKNLEMRASLAKEIGEIKKKQGQAIYDPNREKALIKELIKKNKSPLKEEAIKAIFQEIISNCRNLEKQQDD